jgi:hypothetical protein
MGRPKGALNRRSQMLLRKLEDDHRFSVVNELIELYHYDKQIIVPLAAKVALNVEEGKSPNFGFTEEEAEMYNNANKNCQNVLIRLLSYCYPKLKATEINAGSGDRVVFNINTAPEIQPSKPSEQGDSKTVH